MRFADPYSVTCPDCSARHDYAPRDLVALKARCKQCASPLDAVGLGMRADLSGWSCYLGKIELAMELEDIFGGEVPDARLEAMITPLDLVQFFAERSNAASTSAIESEVLAALGRVRRGKAVSADDLRIGFIQLFAVETHP